MSFIGLGLRVTVVQGRQVGGVTNGEINLSSVEQKI